MWYAVQVMTGREQTVKDMCKRLIDKKQYNDIFVIRFDKAKRYYGTWHKEKEIWYKIVNHEYFDDICLSLNIIEQSIKYDDKLNALEQVETIKMLLNNILESEKCDLNHIF